MLVASRQILSSCKHRIDSPYTGSTNIPQTFPSKDGETIYVHPTALHIFITHYLPRLRFQFILVSGDSDLTIPTDVQVQADYILKHPMLIRWYSQNCILPSGKLCQMPIGLDFHTMASRSSDWGPQQSVESQINDLNTIKAKNNPKQNKCYANFQFLMNTRYAQDRLDAIQKISKELVYYEPQKVPRIQSWNTMSTYKYVLSPHGNGFDCHRTWEALALGCIPILKSSPLDPLFEGLPVLIVKDWSEVTQELLDTFVPAGCLDKLALSYWISEFNK